MDTAIPLGTLPAEPWQTTYDFIVTSMTLHSPDGLEPRDEEVPNPCGTNGFSRNTTYYPLEFDGLVVDGFDLDGDEGQGGGICPQRDFVSPSGEPGIDNAFLHVIDMLRPFRPGQAIDLVLSTAPKQGLVRVGIRLSGVDDVDNDDEVEVLVTNTIGTPLIGADGEIIAGSSVAVDPNPEFQSRFGGRIVDGVLEAGPADIAIGGINLLVVEDRVVSLTGARMRGTVKAREFGGYEVDALVSGWWQRDNMSEAIGGAILSLGANDGELSCVLDNYSDRASDGVNCDTMSTMLEMKAVSAFITGIDEPKSEGE